MFHIAAVITIASIIFSCNFAFSYEANKNDMMSFLRSRGHKVSIDKDGDIVVKIRTDSGSFKVYVFLRKSEGKIWGIKTRYKLPLRIPADKTDFMMRLANVYNRRKGAFRTAYLRKKKNRIRLIVKSWFPCEYVNDSAKDAMFREYYANSFKALIRQMKTVHSATKCVLNNPAEAQIKNCLAKFGLSKGF